jgi:hypothetical protein
VLVLTALVAMSAPAGAAPPISTGQVTGNVVVHRAPAGFSGEVGVIACPSPVPSGGLCPSPQFAYSGSGGSYTMVLPTGTWQLTGFYEVEYGDGTFLGPDKTVTITPGGTVRQNTAIAYQVPATLVGTVTVTGVPSGVSIESAEVIACPASDPLVGGTPSPLCATAFPDPGSDEYSIPTLPGGAWLLYIGYDTEFGLTTITTPTPVTVPKATTVTADLSEPYQPPTNALVEGTVTVTGAPAGISDVAGVGGCATTGGRSRLCADPQYTLVDGSGGSYQLVLPAGQWNLAGFYELAFFGGQFLSPIQNVTLAAGTIVDLDFTVPYVAPATVTATVSVTGVPAGTTIEATILMACPTIAPYDGITEPIECVTTSSPPGIPDSIGTLPPGKWLLYPGYETGTGGLVGTKATRVTLRSGATTTRHLTISYVAS